MVAILLAACSRMVCLGVKGEKSVLLYPSVKGFSYDEKGLLWPLIVAKLKF